MVKSNSVPLSSDAYSNFGSKDPLHNIHNSEVREATRRLHQETIPNFAKTLDNLNSKVLYHWLTPEKFHRYVLWELLLITINNLRSFFFSRFF